MTEEKTTFRKGLAHGSPVMPNNQEKFAEDTPPPSSHVVGPADQIVGQIEELFPNWRSYRDLVDCITCELHKLRKRAEGGR